MTHITIEQCRQHWQQLPPHVKERDTAKHLLAVLTVAERLFKENNKMEMELREIRLRADTDDSD